MPRANTRKCRSRRDAPGDARQRNRRPRGRFHSKSASVDESPFRRRRSCRCGRNTGRRIPFSPPPPSDGKALQRRLSEKRSRGAVQHQNAGKPLRPARGECAVTRFADPRLDTTRAEPRCGDAPVPRPNPAEKTPQTRGGGLALNDSGNLFMSPLSQRITSATPSLLVRPSKDGAPETHGSGHSTLLSVLICVSRSPSK